MSKYVYTQYTTLKVQHTVISVIIPVQKVSAGHYIGLRERGENLLGACKNVRKSAIKGGE